MGNEEPRDKNLSYEEVRSRLEGMPTDLMARAQSLARVAAAGLVGWDADDLLSEAFTKLLETDRAWRRDVHVLVTLQLVMRSIAFNERKKAMKGPVDHHVPIDKVDSNDESFLSVLERAEHQGLTPEEEFISKQSISRIYDLVKDDEELALLVMAFSDGMKGQEAADECSLTIKQYEAARKRLQTRLKKI